MKTPGRTEATLYTIIERGLASYRELRDYYTVEEAIDLYEIALVSAYNEAAAADEIKARAKASKGR